MDYNLDDFEEGPSGIGSQDFDDNFELGIDWGDGDKEDRDGMSVDGSVGVGRDAGSPRHSVGSQFLGKNNMDVDDIISRLSMSRDPSEQPFPMDIDMDMGGVDLGDLGIGFDGEREKTPGQTRSSRACEFDLYQCTLVTNTPLSIPAHRRSRNPAAGCRDRRHPHPRYHEEAQGKEANH